MEVFFYGLFMDVNILKKNGITPSNVRTGYLNNYALKIGNRASLIPARNERAYGMVMTVDNKLIHDLYTEESVADYLPEEVIITTDTDELVTATCYNLPPESLTGTNTSYAKSLFELAQNLAFPEDYLEKIRKMIET